MTAKEWLMRSGKVQAVLTDAEGTAVIMLPGWKPPAFFAKHPRDLLVMVNDAKPTGSLVGFRCTAPATKFKGQVPRRWDGEVLAEDGNFCKFKAYTWKVKARWYHRSELSDFTPPRHAPPN